MGRLALLLVLTAAFGFAQRPAIFSQLDEMLASLSEITGWQVRKKVPAELLGKDKFRLLVEASIKDAASDKEIQADELTLKMFGLVPQDFNLVRETADLYTEQAAAFYDYRKKKLFLLESTTGEDEQRLAVVHELAHALADQRHSLGKYMRRGSPDDDALSARQAVTEGQATWLSWAYFAKRAGGKAEIPQRMVDELANQAGATGEEYPVLARAPLYIRESLVFPYTEGLRFQDAVFRERGRGGFDEVFQRPPVSTQHIMHARTYLAGALPSTPRLPAWKELSPGGEMRTLIEGRLGEFDISALLRQYVGEKEGAEAAGHWRGGLFRLGEYKSAKTPVLVHTAQWDSPQSARAYFDLYRRVLGSKWKKMAVTAAGETQVSGQGDSGRFVVSIAGDTVQSVEGLR